jgi:predicted transcriptional regulator
MSSWAYWYQSKRGVHMETKLVKDFMALPALVLSEKMSITNAVRQIAKHQLSAAPVVNELGELQGLLSEADCMQTVLTSSYFPDENAMVSDKMSTQLQTVNANSQLTKAAEVMLDNKRRVVPVVEGQQLVGVITRHQVLSALLDVIEAPKFKK